MKKKENVGLLHERNGDQDPAVQILFSPSPIPGPFSFYTTNEIFVEDVYPHVKLDVILMTDS